MATVLIINNDIGFTFWLGQTLNEAGYATLPARGVSDAVELLSEHKVQPDLLIINPASPGVLDLMQTCAGPKCASRSSLPSRGRSKPSICSGLIACFSSPSVRTKRYGRSG